MLKLLGAFLLWILSIVLTLAFTITGVGYDMAKAFWQVQPRTGITNSTRKFYTLAAAVDIYGATLCRELFNDTLIKPDSAHRFGEPGLTISETIGWNITTGTLTKTGRVVNSILNFFEKNHSLKAIGWADPQIK